MNIDKDNIIKELSVFKTIYCLLLKGKGSMSDYLVVLVPMIIGFTIGSIV